MTDLRVYFFGCWNEAGHYLHEPGGRYASRGTPFDMYRGVSLDGNYAPRTRTRRGIVGELCWGAQCATREERQDIEFVSSERPQGEFLRHQRDGFTLISWWDRAQGDGRGACNSTFLLEGERTSAEMLAALAVHFPHVVGNLERAGVRLVDVTP